jgi:hypothetical protein
VPDSVAAKVLLLKTIPDVKTLVCDQQLHLEMLEYPRRTTSFPRMHPEVDNDPANNASFPFNFNPVGMARHLLRSKSTVASMHGADSLHQAGFRGEGIRVAVFDTGIHKEHRSFKNLKERSNWTNEKILDDVLGHGTFVAGVIGSSSATCPGFAPSAEIYTFRVFNSKQISYTSWFLDAFNYALHLQPHIINLSIGGPDFGDQPFVEKVNELSNAGITLISAVGNDGPLWGTVNNPADQWDVIGVGGLATGGGLAPFSSRGMSLWELPAMGRIKPDITTYATGIWGPSTQVGGESCREMSGTSAATPIVTGGLALLLSTLPHQQRAQLIQPGLLKQLTHASATLQRDLSYFEQGAGLLDLQRGSQWLQSFTPHLSAFPPHFIMGGDTSSSASSSPSSRACETFWPWCLQPLYYSMQAFRLNFTLISSLAPRTILSDATWQCTLTGGKKAMTEAPVARMNATDGFATGSLARVHLDFPSLLWPYTGHLALSLQIAPALRDYRGPLYCQVTLQAHAPPQGKYWRQGSSSTLVLPLQLSLIPTPPRQRRLLWDQFHSLSYPLAGFVPADNIGDKGAMDMHGDHLYTNYRGLFHALRDSGYFVEIASESLLCVQAKNYGALLLVDSEDEFSREERDFLKEAVQQHQMGLIVMAGWYHAKVMTSLAYHDDSMQRRWSPIVGASNIPALNRVLLPWGMQFGYRLITGEMEVAGLAHPLLWGHGTEIASAPAGAAALFAEAEDATAHYSEGAPRKHLSDVVLAASIGQVVAIGSSSCVDDDFLSGDSRSSRGKQGSAKAKVNDCFPLVLEAVQVAVGEGRGRGGGRGRGDSYHSLPIWKEMAPLTADWLEAAAGPTEAALPSSAVQADFEGKSRLPPSGWTCDNSLYLSWQQNASQSLLFQAKDALIQGKVSRRGRRKGEGVEGDGSDALTLLAKGFAYSILFSPVLIGCCLCVMFCAFYGWVMWERKQWLKKNPHLAQSHQHDHSGGDDPHHPHHYHHYQQQRQGTSGRQSSAPLVWSNPRRLSRDTSKDKGKEKGREKEGGKSVRKGERKRSRAPASIVDAVSAKASRGSVFE